MRENCGRRDYSKYAWKKEELVLSIGKATGTVVALAYFFFRSIWAVPVLLPVGLYIFHLDLQKKSEQNREEFLLQFRECILSVSGSLYAGYAVENAFVESRTEIQLMFGEESDMYRELEYIRRGLVMNGSLEEQLKDLALRSGHEELIQFAEVFAIAKRGGGNVAETIRSFADMLGQRMEVLREMQTMLVGKITELWIMRFMPFGMLLYVDACYPGYFSSLYHNLQGVAVMSFCLLLYLGANGIGEYCIQKTKSRL